MVLATTYNINCDNPKGIGTLQEDHRTLIIDCTICEADGARSAPRRFIGTRD